MRSSNAALIAGSLLAAASFARVARAEAPPTLGWIGSEARADGQPRDLMQVIPAITVKPAAATAWVLYLNKNGGTFTPGNNDSRTNVSSVPQQTSVIAPWNVSATDWQTVVTCIQQEFAAYDITVTDVDPGQTPHIEAVIAGNAADLGLASNVGGVSPFTVDCGTIPNSIVYAFAAEYGTQYQTVCEVAAQEIAHSFGLDHEVLASDPMTYLSYNGHKTFQNQTASCGETSGPRACGLVLQGYPSCRADQNSVALLTARVGLASDTVPPTVAITSPANGASVKPGFTISVNASDNTAIAKVELVIDGALVDTRTAAPFTFTAPSTLAMGGHAIAVNAYDTKNMTTSSVDVTVSPTGGDGSGSGNGSGGGNGSGSDDGGVIVGGCSAGGTPGLTLAIGIVLGLWLRRRRR